MKNANYRYLTESARIADAYFSMYANKVCEASNETKYLVAKLGKDGSPVASKGGNGAYGSQFSEYDSLVEAKKKCREMSSKSGSTCIVSKVGKDGNEKVVFRCGGNKVCEAVDIDGNELSVGDYVEVFPEYDSPFNDRISKIVGNRIYLSAHHKPYIGDDMVKSDKKIIDTPVGRAKSAKTKTIYVGKRTAADEHNDFKSQIGIKTDD